MKLVQLDLNEMKSEEEIHTFLMEQMDFPKHYGKNLDALYDALTDSRNESYCVEMVRCSDEQSPLYEFSRRLEKVMEDAAQTVEEKEGKWYAVFSDFIPLQQPSLW